MIIIYFALASFCHSYKHTQKTQTCGFPPGNDKICVGLALHTSPPIARCASYPSLAVSRWSLSSANFLPRPGGISPPLPSLTANGGGSLLGSWGQAQHLQDGLGNGASGKRCSNQTRSDHSLKVQSIYNTVKAESYSPSASLAWLANISPPPRRLAFIICWTEGWAVTILLLGWATFLHWLCFPILRRAARCHPYLFEAKSCPPSVLFFNLLCLVL